MIKFYALFKKELLVLSRDLHGLLVLFAMPAAFILIMSLALQDTFDERNGTSVKFALIDQHSGDLSKHFIEQLQQNTSFKMFLLNPKEYNAAILREQITAGKYKFALLIPKNFSQRLLATQNEPAGKMPALEILIAPTVKSYLRSLFVSAVNAQLMQIKITTILHASADKGNKSVPSTQAIQAMSKINISERYVFKDLKNADIPTSVQQNVPAWLVFAMFFVVIPLSTAFIIERQHGTFLRLRIMNISAINLLASKLIPYYLINQVQMLAMLLVGMYLVPLLNGSQLNQASSIPGLILISSATSFAAISYALLISTVAKTTMQATTFGGVSNIIFGALGGIMVPKFIMPQFMQDITVFSPMSWGLEGFLDVFLRNAGWQAILPEFIHLFVFGSICLIIASVIFRRQT